MITSQLDSPISSLRLIQLIEKKLDELIPSLTVLQKACRYSLLLKGKRLRPLFVLGTTLSCGGDINAALAPACAIEMIHTYSLIHDDLPSMDNDDMRRGSPSLHKVFPEGIALLAGDHLLTFAFEVLAHSTLLSPHQIIQLIQTLSASAGINGLTGGQAIDLLSTSNHINKEELFKMHLGKTAALFSCSFQFGAIISNQLPAVVQLFKEIGLHFGLAYQLLDDLEDQGKEEKKMTAVSIFSESEIKEQVAVHHEKIDTLFAKLPFDTESLRKLMPLS